VEIGVTGIVNILNGRLCGSNTKTYLQCLTRRVCLLQCSLMRLLSHKHSNGGGVHGKHMLGMLHWSVDLAAPLNHVLHVRQILLLRVWWAMSIFQIKIVKLTILVTNQCQCSSQLTQCEYWGALIINLVCMVYRKKSDEQSDKLSTKKNHRFDP
jgi:hypothetical protein